MGSFKLFETDMKVPCDTFQCHERAAYFIGKEDSPKSMLTKVCEKCAGELKDDILSKVTFVKATAEEIEAKAEGFLGTIVTGDFNPLPFEEPPKEANLEDLTVAELKKLASEAGHEGISKKTKAELIELLVN
jgi:hypothetical protein